MWSAFTNCDDAFTGAGTGIGIEDDIFSLASHDITAPVSNPVDSFTTNHAEVALKIDRKTLTLQPWSTWLQRFGGNMPEKGEKFIVKEEVDESGATCSNVAEVQKTKNQTLSSTLNCSRAPLYGTCPSLDLFNTVKCKHCQINVKPMAYRAHMKHRHDVALKSPDFEGVSLWSSIISPQSITDEQEAALAVEQISEKSPSCTKKSDSPAVKKSLSTTNLFDKYGIEPSPTSSTKSRTKKSTAESGRAEKSVTDSSKMKNRAKKKECSQSHTKDIDRVESDTSNYVVSQKSEHRLKITISKKLLEAEALNNGDVVDSKTGLPVKWTIPKIRKTKVENKQVPKMREESINAESKALDVKPAVIADAHRKLTKSQNTEEAAVISITNTPCTSNAESLSSNQIAFSKDSTERKSISVVGSKDKSKSDERCATRNLKNLKPAANCPFGVRRYGLNSCPVYNRKYDFLRQMFELTLNCDFASNAFTKASTSLIKRNRSLKLPVNKDKNDGCESLLDRSILMSMPKPAPDEELAISSNENYRTKSILKQKSIPYPSANVHNIMKDQEPTDSQSAAQNVKIPSNHNGLSRPGISDGISVRLGRMENPVINHTIPSNSLPTASMNGISVHDPRLHNKQNNVQQQRQQHQIPMLRSVKREEHVSTFQHNVLSGVSVVSNAANVSQQTPIAMTTSSTTFSTFTPINLNRPIKQEMTGDTNKAPFVVNKPNANEMLQSKAATQSDMVYFGSAVDLKSTTSVQNVVPQRIRPNPLAHEYFNIAQSRKRASVPSIYTPNVSSSFGMAQRSAITVRAKRPRMGSLEYQTPQQMSLGTQRSMSNNFSAFAHRQKVLGTNFNRESLSIVKLDNNNAQQHQYSVAINAQNLIANGSNAPPTLTPQAVSDNVYGRQTIVNASGGVRAIATTGPGFTSQRVIKFSGGVGSVQHLSRPSSRTSASTTPPSSNRSSPLSFTAASNVSGITASGTVTQQPSTSAATLLTLPLNAVILDGNRVYTVQNGPNGPKLVESAGNNDGLTTPTPTALSMQTAKTKVTFASVSDTLQRVTLSNATSGGSGTIARSVQPKVVMQQRTMGRQQQHVEQIYRQQRGMTTVQQTIQHRTNGGPSTVFVKEIKNGYATPGVSVRSGPNASGSYPHTIMVCASNLENKTPSNAHSASSSPSSTVATVTGGYGKSCLVNFSAQKSNVNSQSAGNLNNGADSSSKINQLPQYQVTRNF